MKKIALFFFCLIFFACGKQNTLDQFNESDQQKSYYMPDVDIYIVRGPTHGFVTKTAEPASDYISKLFLPQSPSVNDGLSQVSIAFYHSKIRIFYIKETGIPTIGDTQVIYNYMRNQTSFTLTNEDGSGTGSALTVDAAPMRLFFMKNVPSTYGVAGLSGIGYKGCTEITSCRKNIVTLIFSGTNAAYYSNFRELADFLIHEWGHYFGLMHSFDSGSCYAQSQASTNRYMDYFNTPTLFIPCERMISEQVIQPFVKTKTLYQPSTPLDITPPAYTIKGQSYHKSQIQVFDHTWQGQLSIQEPQFLLEENDYPITIAVDSPLGNYEYISLTSKKP